MGCAGRLSAAVLVGIAYCLLVGRCQGQSDTPRGCYYDGDGERSRRVLMDLLDCSTVADVCQESCGPGEAYCESKGAMTPANCKALCRAGNYQYYGLEGGNQCFCGGALASPFANGRIDSVVNCTDPCSGDASFTCGGEFKIDIFEFEEPVKSPGCFFPAAVAHAIVDDVGVGTGETLTFRCRPGYQLVGSPDFVCMENRMWSSSDLPICNYTGVYPVSTTEMATTTTEMSPSTAKEVTTLNPTTATEYTTSHAPDTKSSGTTAEPPATATGTRAPSTRAPSTAGTTDTASGGQTSVRDILPYIIAISAAWMLLLVIFLIAILIHTNRKVSGNAKRNISLKPSEMAPVTLLNTGYTPPEGDPEAAVHIPDILLDGTVAGGSGAPRAGENQYEGLPWPSMPAAGGDPDDDDEIVKLKGADQMWGRPVSEAVGPGGGYSGESGRAQGDRAATASLSGAAGSEASTDDASEASAAPTATTYENVDGRWNSEETLASEEGRSFFADARTTTATPL